MLPETFGKTGIVRIVHFYSKLWEKKYGFKPDINFGAVGKLFKPLLTNYSEYQVALLILVHMHWKGANNDSLFIEKKLSDACYPITWIPKAINEYRAFAINYLGLDFNNQEEIKEYVDDYDK